MGAAVCTAVDGVFIDVPTPPAPPPLALCRLLILDIRAARPLPLLGGSGDVRPAPAGGTGDGARDEAGDVALEDGADEFLSTDADTVPPPVRATNGVVNRLPPLLTLALSGDVRSPPPLAPAVSHWANCDTACEIMLHQTAALGSSSTIKW